MVGGSILERMKKLYKDDLKATAALEKIINKNTKTKFKEITENDSDAKKVRKLQFKLEIKKSNKDDLKITKAKKQYEVNKNRFKKYLNLINDLDMNEDQTPSDLITAINKVKSTNIRDIKVGKANTIVKNLKCAFEVIKNELSESPVVAPIVSIINLLEDIDLKNSSYLRSATEKVKILTKQLRDEARKG
ncbi:MAG: hypothetical protein LBJ32_04620 [Oscillospiraceae bacterium]|jgi:hypothetical protein|nr:hypothetical protein [Oscillospiraceae bacterium]